MKRLLGFLIILLVAAWAGISIAEDPGYMLLAYKKWTLETPLWFGIILWFIFAVLIFLIAHLYQSIEHLRSLWRAWHSRRQLTRSNNLTIRSLLECIEGYFESAQKNVLKALPNAELPFVNYLIAAYCAHHMNKGELREKYFLEAKNLIPDSEVALDLLKIEWLVESEDLVQAENRIELLLTEDPHQKKALLIAKKIYEHRGAWNQLLKIAQILRKRKIITLDHYEEIQSKAYAAQLMQIAKNKNIKNLHACWLAIPSYYQQLPQISLVYARALIELQQGIQAEEILRHSLKKFWDKDLVREYGLAITPKTEEQLKHAEKWLQDHADDATLLLTLGRLCSRIALWSKARSYLETSLNIVKKPETYLLLAQLSEGHADYQKATEYYAKGLELSLNKNMKND